MDLQVKILDDPIDQAILRVLEERGGYVSGGDLGRHLGLSRAAIWKRIQGLRGKGYRIDAGPRQGYRLAQKPDLLSSAEILRHLRTSSVGREVHAFQQVNSTNDVAYEMALHGAPEGTVVVAESQTRGRGRLSRSWVSPFGKNLYLSLILRPSMPAAVAPVMTYAGALATAEAIEKTYSLHVELKWPNDVLVGGKKLAGLLNEVKAETDRLDFIVLGFGVNLNMDPETLPPDLWGKATSVMREVGHRVSRIEFARSLLETIEGWYETFLVHGPARIIEKWESMASLRGRFLEVRSFGRVWRGVAEGLDQDGALVLRSREGEAMRIVAGDLREG